MERTGHSLRERWHAAQPIRLAPQCHVLYWRPAVRRLLPVINQSAEAGLAVAPLLALAPLVCVHRAAPAACLGPVQSIPWTGPPPPNWMRCCGPPSWSRTCLAVSQVASMGQVRGLGHHVPDSAPYPGCQSESSPSLRTCAVDSQQTLCTNCSPATYVLDLHRPASGIWAGP